MRRRRVWLRRVGRAVGTVAIGALLGFLIPTIVTDMSAQAGGPGQRRRVPARAPVHQRLHRRRPDAPSTACSVRTDIKLRASRFRAEFARVDAPIHLGSYVGGGYTVHAYGIHVVRPDGTEDTLSWRVVTRGGQVGVLLPPSPIEAE